ncbi:winged helix-turn-helix transcriptional regulator [Candidatus Pacearchaeota archaeon]|nr:winged helix-turn-helix transcriptional regulator [Candidatus Pacearchaeota archaeon]
MPYENLNHKFREAITLDNRRKIYDLVRSNPGCHFREIERKIKMPYGTLRYHLNFLVKKELLIEKKDDNNIRYFSMEFNSGDYDILSLLRQGSIRKILVFLATSKYCAHKDIVSFTGLSPSTVSWHLNKLLRKKIIARDDSKNWNYRLILDKENIIRILIVYKESFLDSLVNKAIEMWEN